jgi:hypothetical protein
VTSQRGERMTRGEDRSYRISVLLLLERCINNLSGTDGQRAFGRSPRSISSRSPLAGVLSSLQSLANSGHAPVSSADPSPLSVFPPHQQRRPGPDKPRRGIPPENWPDVLRRIEQGESLRQVAQSYSVSYETIRRVIHAMRRQGREGQR